MMHTIKILIVDDVLVNRLTIKLSLKNENYTFIEAVNGEEAIEKALRHQPDVILMDAVMPIMDGFEATKKIRALDSIERTPILMITSLSSTEDKIKALEIGVNDFISKPFDQAELQARCKSYAHISVLNKKYSLATINSITNLPNKMALSKDLSERDTLNELFLIKIDNMEEIENFYGDKIIEHLENKFASDIREYFEPLSRSDIYHIDSGKYAILLNNKINLEDEKIKAFCYDLVECIKNNKIESNGYSFNVNITMSFAASTESTYADANETLRSAIAQKREFLLSCDVVSDLKKQLEINLNMIESIKSALKDGRISPHFQPIWDNRTKEIYKFESLIRMIDEDGRIIYPGPLFLDTAKKAKLYPQITKVLVEKVFEKIRESGKEFSMNISSLDIEDSYMSAFLLDTIRKNADVADKLILELLEDKDTEDYEKVKNFIVISKKYGIKIAIDDFGSGYSNFMRILEFEPDIIKIDGSLIKDIHTSKLARNTVEMIKLFADKIGALTIAEYVENQEIYDAINEIGIDFSQGYFIGKSQKELVFEGVFELVS